MEESKIDVLLPMIATNCHNPGGSEQETVHLSQCWKPLSQRKAVLGVPFVHQFTWSALCAPLLDQLHLFSWIFLVHWFDSSALPRAFAHHQLHCQLTLDVALAGSMLGECRGAFKTLLLLFSLTTIFMSQTSKNKQANPCPILF